MCNNTADTDRGLNQMPNARRLAVVVECNSTRRQSGARRPFARRGSIVLLALLCLAAALLLPASVHAASTGDTVDVGDISNTFSTSAASGLAQYVQTAITSRNGLPQNSVRSITQSTDGYIWLATEEGLVRYDGSRTLVFDHRNSPVLHDNFVQSISAGTDGSVWVGTRSGISHYVHGEFVSHANNDGLTLHDVLADSRGTVWVGTVHGLFSVSPDGKTLEEFAGVPCGTTIRQMAQGVDGSVWLATSTGVWHVKDGSGHRHGNADGLPETEIKVLTVARDGTLWIATPTELLHWKEGDGVVGRKPLDAIAPQGRISTLLVDSSGKLWIGMLNEGVATLQGNTVERFGAANGLPSDSVTALGLDRDDNLWIGFNDGGAVRFHSGLFHTYGDREGLSGKNVWEALSARDGSVWTATTGMGINHLFPDGHVETLTRRDGLPTGQVYSMFEDADGSIWVGDDSGNLLHIHGEHHLTVFHNPRHEQEALRTILRGPGGNLYLLYHSNFGLERFKDGVFEVEPHNIPGTPSVAVRAPDGSLWIGSNQGGVSHWNGKLLEVYGHRQGFTSEFVLSLAADAAGSVWVGSSPGGLSLIRGGRVTTFTPDNGLFDYTVGTVTDDRQGYLWMTSNKGIFKVRKQEMLDVADRRADRIHSIVYGLPDGLRSAESNYSTTPAASLAVNGHLWFATTEGLVTVVPSVSAVRTSRPQATIEAIVVDGKALPGGEFKTRAGSHDVEFDFAAPDFAAPERLQFRYRLKGFDHDWIEAGHRNQAFYTRLPPGHYTLQVQAEDGNGWPEDAASTRLTIPPHLWQTVWFRGFGVLLLGLAGYLAYEWRVYALRRSQRILQEQVVVRTAELQDAMREAKAAHHELQELATRDSMTRLWNRRHILNMLCNEANRAERESLSLCVLMLDVDHFKSVNDSKGHLAGDRVLQAVANVLIDQTRPYDCAGRYGGEEFLVILCNCSLQNGIRRANMIREAIAKAAVEWNGTSIAVTASFGVALHHPGKTIEAVLQEADEALYLAKQAGRNRVGWLPGNTAPAGGAAAPDPHMALDDSFRGLQLKPA